MVSRLLSTSGISSASLLLAQSLFTVVFMKRTGLSLGLYLLLGFGLSTSRVYGAEALPLSSPDDDSDTLSIPAAESGSLQAPSPISPPETTDDSKLLAPTSPPAATDRPNQPVPVMPSETPLQPLLDLDDTSDSPMDRVTSVAELADVNPNDWAYQALQSLIERYGVIAGYPDKTFRGDRPLTRSEFAAALRAAIPKVDLSSFATKKDLEDLQRLQAEFSKELEAVNDKVTRLERVLRPVSETTKLTGEVIFAPIFVSNSQKAGRNDATDNEVTMSSRVKLTFLTNLSGKNLLRTTLKANNIVGLQRATGTDMARLSFQGDNRNRFELDELSLRSRLSQRITLSAFAAGGSLNKFTEPLNPFLAGSSQGSISRFGQRNPIYRQGGEVGLGFNVQLSKAVKLDIGYLADRVNDPDEGFQKGAYGAIAQLTFRLSKTAGIGLTYVRSFNALDTNAGSSRADDPFNNRSNAITADSFGLETTVGINKNLALSGWVGFSRATAKDLPRNPSASIFNWAVTIAFPNLGQEGNLLGFMIGQPPKVIANDFQRRGESFRDRDTSWHLEAFYRIRVNKGVSITPGFVVILNPEHNQSNDPIFIGTLRTTFSF